MLYSSGEAQGYIVDVLEQKYGALDLKMLSTAEISERLNDEDKEKAIEKKKRKDRTDSISFLEEKKSEVEDAIKKLGETEELTEALNLLKEELKGKEKEL